MDTHPFNSLSEVSIASRNTKAVDYLSIYSPAVKDNRLNLTISQYYAVINLGKVLSVLSSECTQSLQKYLDYLPVLDTLQFIGIPQDMQEELKTNFLNEYFSALSLIRHPSVNSAIQQFFETRANGYISYLVKMSRSVAKKKPSPLILASLIHSTKPEIFTKSLGSIMLESISHSYLGERQKSSKYDVLHTTVLDIARAAVLSFPKLIKNYHNVISELFTAALKLIKKYQKRRTSSEKLLMSCVRFILAVLTYPDVQFLLLNDRQQGLKLSDSPFESYVEFFIKNLPIRLANEIFITASEMIIHSTQFAGSRSFELCIFLRRILDPFIEEDPNLDSKICDNLLKALNITQKETIYFVQELLPVLASHTHPSLRMVASALARGIKEDKIQQLLKSSILISKNKEPDLGVLISCISSEKSIDTALQDLLQNYSKGEAKLSHLKDLAKHVPQVLPLLLKTFTSTIREWESERLISRKHHKNADQIFPTVRDMLVAIIECLKTSKPQMSEIRDAWMWLVHLLTQYEVPANGDISILEFNRLQSQLAEQTPILTWHRFEEEVFSSPHFLQHFIPVLKDQLRKVSSRKMLEDLDYAELLFAFTVYRIEGINRSLERAIIMLEDEHVYKNTPDLAELIREIILVRLQECFNMTCRSAPGSLREEKIAKDVELLLIKSVCPVESSRNLAHELLNLSKKRELQLQSCYLYEFPYIIQHKSVLNIALDLLGSVHNQMTKEFDSASHSVTLPHSQKLINLPSSRSILRNLFEFLENSISECIGKTLYMSSRDFMSAFASYIYSSNVLVKNEPHDSRKIAHITNFSISFVNHLYYAFKLSPKCPLEPYVIFFKPYQFHSWFISNGSKKTVTLDDFSNIKFSTHHNELLSNDSQVVQIQVNYYGYIHMMRETSQNVIPKLIDELIATSSMKQPKKEYASSPLFDALGKLTTALIFSHEAGEEIRDYLHAVVWGAMLSLSFTSISAGIICWDWIGSSLIHYKTGLFAEIHSVWRYLLYRGGIVIPGSTILPILPHKFESQLLKSAEKVHLNGANSVNDLPCSGWSGILTTVNSSSVRQKELINIQLSMVEFFTKQYYNCLARDRTSASLIYKMLYELFLLPPNLEARSEKLTLQLVLKLLLVACDIAKDHSVSNDLPPPYELQNAAFTFTLKLFSHLPFWQRSPSTVKFKMETKLLKRAIKIISNEKLQVQPVPKTYSNPAYRPRINQQNFHHSELALLNPNAPLYEQPSLTSKKKLLLSILSDELSRLINWNRPNQIVKKIIKPKLYAKSYELLKTAWSINPLLALNLPNRLTFKSKSLGLIHECLTECVVEATDLGIVLYNYPAAMVYYVDGKCDGRRVGYWETPEYTTAIQMLNHKSPQVRNVGIRSLYRASHMTQMFYLPQILETMNPKLEAKKYKRRVGEDDVCGYLLKSARESQLIRTRLEWVLRVTMMSIRNPPKNALNPVRIPPEETLCHIFYNTLISDLRHHSDIWEQFCMQNEFFEKINMITANLIPGDPNTNVHKIREGLVELAGEDGNNIPNDVFLPTSPENKLVAVRTNSGRPLQSAKRVPILILFNTIKQNPEEKPQVIQQNEQVETLACIFKVNDDVRNDQISLQVIELMSEIFKENNLPLFLRPYQVISTITTINDEELLGGIIECIPGCKSRDEIGKEGSLSLHEYFLQKFGPEHSQSYLTARKNFIHSLAGYAVASYILQIKDRHNGNILIDSSGHLIHIDFGFILSISPGGNMKFERPDFKLTREMVAIMGGSNSENFLYFRELLIQGFLAIRQRARDFITLIGSLEEAGYTCFRKNTMKELHDRLMVNSHIHDAVKAIQTSIYNAQDSVFTNWYDRIQLMQQKIEY